MIRFGRRIHYLVYARDFKDAKALDRRMAARPDHLNRAKASFEKNELVLGGAMVENGKMVGSMMVLDVPNLESAQQWVNQDAYVKGKVWDKIDIVEYKMALKK